MADLLPIIPVQNFELIRNRIFTILQREVANQFAENPDPILDATVFLEKNLPFTLDQIPAINVILESSTFIQKTPSSKSFNLIFNIDIYHKASSTSTESGDSLSKIYLHRLIAICWAILENSQYIALDFSENLFVESRAFTAFEIAEVPKNTADSLNNTQNVSMARMVFQIKINQDTKIVPVPKPVGISETVIKLTPTVGFKITENGIGLVRS